MKKLVYVVMSLLILSTYSCTTGHYVSARPGNVIVTRPISPGPGYTWIDGDYYWSRGRYQYRNGYWARPRAGRVWHSGGWGHGSRGYYWRGGRWR